MTTGLTPGVSVILPTYNRAALIKRAIGSVLAQSYTDFELLVIDDASTDNTTDIISGIPDRRLRYISHDRRLGAAAARNTGLAQSRAPLAAFQDSDDAWLPEKLVLTVAAMARAPAHIGIIHTNFWSVNKEKRRRGISRRRALFGDRRPNTRLNGDLNAALARGNFITTQAALARRSCLEQVGGFDEKLERLQDWDLWLRAARSYQFQYIDLPLVKVYASTGRLSDRPEVLMGSFERILEKIPADWNYTQTLQAQYHFAQGDTLCACGDPVAGREEFKQAIQLAPVEPVYRYALVCARLGSGIYRRLMAAYSYHRGA